MNPSVAKMGTVDLLQGLLATITIKEAEPEGQEPVNIALGELTNVLHAMQRRAEFGQDLRLTKIEGTWHRSSMAPSMQTSLTIRHGMATSPGLDSASIWNDC